MRLKPHFFSYPDYPAILLFILLPQLYEQLPPIGCISLKRQTDPAFSDFPENAVWMGGLQIIPEERYQGLGQALFKFSQKIAKLFGHEKLYFYTSILRMWTGISNAALN